MKLIRPPGRFVEVVGFSSRPHGACKGEGCSGCHGSGSVPGDARINRFVPDKPDRRSVDLLYRRRAAGLKLSEMAKRLGLSLSQVSDLERGRLVPGSWADMEAALSRAGIKPLPADWRSRRAAFTVLGK